MSFVYLKIYIYVFTHIYIYIDILSSVYPVCMYVHLPPFDPDPTKQTIEWDNDPMLAFELRELVNPRCYPDPPESRSTLGL